jgi:SPOR domain
MLCFGLHVKLGCLLWELQVKLEVVKFNCFISQTLNPFTKNTMTNSKQPFRFDHRELTVIFSLFIFSSLLMFTVGIMVGKGIAQSKTEKPTEVAEVDKENKEEPKTETASEKKDLHAEGAPASENHAALKSSPSHSEGTSVSTEPAPSHPLAKKEKELPSQLESVTNEVADSPSHPPTPTAKHGPESAPVKEKSLAKASPSAPELMPESQTEGGDLELIPEKPRTGDVRASLADLANTQEVSKTLKDPKIQTLLDGSPPPQKRNVASLHSSSHVNSTPKSFSEGKYTVQVGSYPSQADATVRLEQLRKQGFPFAYTTTKELGDKKEPWYRVWLGYFSDPESAKASGELLQQRGEVKSYLVRKSQTNQD